MTAISLGLRVQEPEKTHTAAAITRTAKVRDGETMAEYVEQSKDA